MPLQVGLQQVGLAKQTARNTPQTNPVFAHGVTGGVAGDYDIAQESAQITSGTRGTAYADRTQVGPGAGKFPFRAHPKTIGLYLLGALGADSVTGVGPYVHTITASTDVNFLTLFGKFAGSIIMSVQDCKIDELSFTWDGAGPVECEATMLGTIPNWAATFTITTDETYADYFMAAGGTFKLDTISSTPATARIKAGKITIKNNLDPIILSASTVPNEMFPGELIVEHEYTIVPDTDLSDLRKVLTGSGSGTTISEIPIYGSSEVTFTKGADILKLASARLPFMAGLPEAAPEGGPAELVLSGSALFSTSGGTPITATLTNGQATY